MATSIDRAIIAAVEAEIWRRGGKKKGQEVWFLCPVHDDHDPSARWNPDKQTWYCDVCNKGGGALDLARRFGIEIGSGKKAKNQNRRIVATYDYRDKNGVLLYQVVRYEPKDFRQRRPDGNGGWIWGLTAGQYVRMLGGDWRRAKNAETGGQQFPAVRLVPYRLPELLGAAPDDWILSAEGERSCDELSLYGGVIATTNSGGAGNWPGVINGYFAGRKVAVIADNDDAGRKHARKVATNLHGVASIVKVIELAGLAEGEDIVDWLGGRDTVDELLDIVEAAPPFEEADGLDCQDLEQKLASLIILTDVEPQDVNWLWSPYIPLGKLTLLEGDPGVGKSWLALALATAISLGKGLSGREPTAPGNILILTAEDGLGDTIRPRLDAMGADVGRVFAVQLNPDASDLFTLDAVGVALLDQFIGKIEARLVIIDPLVAYTGSSLDIHRANEVRSIMARLAALAEAHDCAIVAIRHLRKSESGKAIYRGLGSIDFTASARSVLLAGCHPDDQSRRALVHIKSNLAAKGPAIGYTLDDGTFYWTGESDMTAADILGSEASGEERSALDDAMAFLDNVLGNGPVPSQKVIAEAKAAGIKKRTLDRAKAALKVQSIKPGGQWCWILPMSRLPNPNTTVGNLDNVKTTRENPSLREEIGDSEGRSRLPKRVLEDGNLDHGSLTQGAEAPLPQSPLLQAAPAMGARPVADNVREVDAKW